MDIELFPHLLFLFQSISGGYLIKAEKNWKCKTFFEKLEVVKV